MSSEGRGSVGPVWGQSRSRVWLIVLAATTLLLPSAASSQSSETPWLVTGQYVPELEAFDDTVRAFMEANDIPSGQLAVTWQGRLVLARGYSRDPGPDDLTLVQPDSLFRIASVSKPLTSMLVHRLVQQGRLDLNARVGDLIDLRPVAGQAADPRLYTVTVRNLLEHLGGFGFPEGRDPMFHDHAIAERLGVALPVTQADIIRYMGSVPFESDPGTSYRYSNYGYMLLARVIEAVTGVDYEEFALRRLRRLGIHRMRLGRSLPHERHESEVAYRSNALAVTVFDPTPSWVPFEYGGFNIENMDGHGGWIASAVELARLIASLDDPSLPGALLTPASIDRMFALPENRPPPYQTGDDYYASGWAVRDYGEDGRSTWHSGSLPGTTTFLLRANVGWGCVVLFNRRNEANPGSYIASIDPLMWRASERVGSWPEHDLFPLELERGTGAQ